MYAIDTHAHLDFPDYDNDRDDLIKQLEQQEIGVITISTDESSVKNVLSLAKQNRLVWGAIGLHPTEISEDTLANLPRLLDEWKALFDQEEKLVALGEVGLDYYHSQEAKGASRQKAALREFLSLAKELDRPIIFHCREAYGDLVTMLADYPGIKGVVHCFTGNKAQAEAFLDLGLHISFAGMVTYKNNAALREVVKSVPIDKLLTETDSPFLAPEGHRGKRNNPVLMLEGAKVMAGLHEMSLDQLLTQTVQNAKKLFKLEI